MFLPHNSNNLRQLPLNPTTTISSSTYSAHHPSLPLNNNLPHLGSWTSHRHKLRLQTQQTICSEEWQLTIVQSTSTTTSLPFLNKISNNNRPSSSNQQLLVLWMSRPQRNKHLLHNKISLVASTCLRIRHNNSPSNNKFNNLCSNNNSHLLHQSPQCGTTALQANCSISAVELWWVMTRPIL